MLSIAPHGIDLLNNHLRNDVLVQEHEHRDRGQDRNRDSKGERDRNDRNPVREQGRVNQKSRERVNDRNRGRGRQNRRDVGGVFRSRNQRDQGLLSELALRGSSPVTRPASEPDASSHSSLTGALDRASSEFVPGAERTDAPRPIETGLTGSGSASSVNDLSRNSGPASTATLPTAFPGETPASAVLESSTVRSDPVKEPVTESGKEGTLANLDVDSYGSLVFATDDLTPIPEFLASVNPEELGGVVSLDTMPRLVDTLPGPREMTDEEIGLNLDQTEFDDTERRLSDSPAFASEREGQETSDDGSTVNQDNAKQGSETGEVEADLDETSFAADIVFADVEEVEAFGGEVAMPEAFSLSDSEVREPWTSNSALAADPIDAFVAAACRIDQIISQAPLSEIGDDSQSIEIGADDLLKDIDEIAIEADELAKDPNEVAEDKTRPIMISLRAGFPLAILGIPVAIANAKCRRREHDKTKIEGWRKRRQHS